MEVIRSISKMQEVAMNIRKKRKSIGFVPTMGYLHDGHLSLMDQAKKENDIIVASIFVNPLQFGPNEDFEKYPRDEQRDTKLAEEIGVDYLFIPNEDEMYPSEPSIVMHIQKRVDVLCGRRRPGHFDGVLTVLTKLFHLVLPMRVYFGLKDAQQVAVVDALIQTHNFPIQLVGLPTKREIDGLAMSSRNVFLTTQERNEAPAIYQSLLTGKQLVVDGERNPAIIVKEVKDIIESQTSAQVEYVEIRTYPDLQLVEKIDGNCILAVAVVYQGARLIDNILMNEVGQYIYQWEG